MRKLFGMIVTLALVGTLSAAPATAGVVKLHSSPSSPVPGPTSPASPVSPTSPSTPTPGGPLQSILQTPIKGWQSGMAVVTYDANGLNGTQLLRVQAVLAPGLTAASFYDPATDSFSIYGPNQAAGALFPAGLQYQVTTNPGTGAGTVFLSSAAATIALLTQMGGPQFYAPPQNPGLYGNTFRGGGTASYLVNFIVNPLVVFLQQQVDALNAAYKKAKAGH